MDHNKMSLVLFAFPFLLLFFFHKLRATKKSTLPPGPKGLPIIGNLHQLDNSALCLSLWELSKKYGPFFSLQLGLKPALVVSSPKLAKEVMKTHDIEFCTRPSLTSFKKVSYNILDMAFSPYSDYWRDMRKISIVHILSQKRVSMSSSIRRYEVGQMIKRISEHASCSKVTNLNDIMMYLFSTITCRIAFGNRYEEEGIERSRFHGLLNEFQSLVITLFYRDCIPFLWWIDNLTGLMGRLERNFKEFDAFYQDIIDEHLDPKKQKPEGMDIVDVLLQMMKQQSYSMELTQDHIKSIIMNLFVAGTDTSAATVNWTMTSLMKNPRVMQKVQAEVRNLFGGKDFIEEEDIQKLPYLKAVVKETMRLYPPVPLLIPRETRQKCNMEGYEIPEKTLVYVNVWAVHRDPETWKDPEEFYPERFLDNTTDFRGQDFELIPFGAGRRICPGINLGVAQVELTLANLLYSFDWKIPTGMEKEDKDTGVLEGIAQHKKSALCLVAKNRT